MVATSRTMAAAALSVCNESIVEEQAKLHLMCLQHRRTFKLLEIYMRFSFHVEARLNVSQGDSRPRFTPHPALSAAGFEATKLLQQQCMVGGEISLVRIKAIRRHYSVPSNPM